MATDRQLRFIALCLIDAKLSGFGDLLCMENGAIRTHERGLLVSNEGGSLLVDLSDNYIVDVYWLYWYGCDDSLRPAIDEMENEILKEAGTNKFPIHLSSDDLVKIQMLIDCYKL